MMYKFYHADIAQQAFVWADSFEKAVDKLVEDYKLRDASSLSHESTNGKWFHAWTPD